MPLSEEEKGRIQQLAWEGKLISKIRQDDFPEYSWEEIYGAAWEGGAQSVLGVQRMITRRLRKLTTAHDQQAREDLVNELERLTRDMYYRVRQNQKKMEKWTKWYNLGAAMIEES